MNQALKQFGFLLQLCLLTFGLTAHGLTLDPSAVSPDALYERITSEASPQEDAFSNRPETLKRAHFPLAKTRISETGPFEKEEEEEVRTTGHSYKIITTSGSGSSAFFIASEPGFTRPDRALTPHPCGLEHAGPFKERTILYQLFRI